MTSRILTQGHNVVNKMCRIIFLVICIGLSKGTGDQYCSTTTTGLPSCTFDTSPDCGTFSSQSTDGHGLQWRRVTEANCSPTPHTNDTHCNIPADWQADKDKKGRFMFLDVTNTSVPTGSKARLTARLLSQNIDSVCITFRYATQVDKVGGQVPTITIYNQVEGKVDTFIDKITEDTKGQWKLARLSSKCVVKHSKLVFEGEKLTPTTLIGLDSIQVTKSTSDCSKCTKDKSGLPSCEFDVSWCTYYMMDALDESFQWAWVSSTNTIFSDWQPANRPQQKGKFLYLTSNDPTVPMRTNATLDASIDSKTIRAVCVRFYYATGTGADTDPSTGATPTIKVMNRLNDGGMVTMGTVNKNTYGGWTPVVIHSCIQPASTITFLSEKVSETAYLAVDSVEITRSNMLCPETLTTTTTSTTPTTTTASTITTPSTTMSSTTPTTTTTTPSTSTTSTKTKSTNSLTTSNTPATTKLSTTTAATTPNQTTTPLTTTTKPPTTPLSTKSTTHPSPPNTKTTSASSSHTTTKQTTNIPTTTISKTTTSVTIASTSSSKPQTPTQMSTKTRNGITDKLQDNTNRNIGKNNVIIGAGSAGAVVFIIVVIGAVWFTRKRNRRGDTSMDDDERVGLETADCLQYTHRNEIQLEPTQN